VQWRGAWSARPHLRPLLGIGGTIALLVAFAVLS
jgi:hypothetical protein